MGSLVDQVIRTFAVGSIDFFRIMTLKDFRGKLQLYKPDIIFSFYWLKNIHDTRMAQSREKNSA